MPTSVNNTYTWDCARVLRVYHSNRLDVLEALMEFIIESKRLDDPFEPEIILVQSPGMAQWLQISLSQKFGIAANIEFTMPASFIWNMFVRVLTGIPEQNFFNKQAMSWKLMTLLPAMLQHEKFAMLRFNIKEDIDNKRKLFQLASRIAELYDRYLVYRPHWLTHWEAGEQVEGLPEAQIWQAQLWKALVEHTAQLGQTRWHRANLNQRFISTLEKSSEPPQGLPNRVFIFGIYALPPVYLKALNALSRYVDIHILFNNPCRYWGDIQDALWLDQLINHQRRFMFTGGSSSVPFFRDSACTAKQFNNKKIQNLTNPLLASWGKLGSDYVHLLSDITISGVDIDAFVDVTPDNLLHNLQRDILELENSALAGLTADEFSRSSKSKRRLDPADRSVTIHVCHSAQREVEVLHDSLLATLETDPDLTTRDIVVMVTDIDSYIPFIQAVFGSATGERYLPYVISDRCARLSHPIIQAFINLLLSLPDSRFTSKEVLALLDVPTLAARFDLNEEGLRYLRRWVKESGVRWGMDDENLQKFELPATGQNTWHFGLTRMLLGYAMDSAQGEWNEVLPYDESSGLIAELVGNLASLLMKLKHWQHGLMQERLLIDWLPVCQDIINDFFLPDQETESAMLLIEQQWHAIIREGIDSSYSESVPFSLLRDELIFRLDQERISQCFLAGPINICTMMPMRSIPFKVVCLLGINNDVYPRARAPLGFDLMSQKPQCGDRNSSDDDRYLFLEALISAQQKLYVSYVGRSIQNNSERFPSILVQELVDYIGQSYYLPGDESCNCDDSERHVIDHITFFHSRMPFDPINYIENERQSYAREWLTVARKVVTAHSNFMQYIDFIQNLDDLPLTTLPFEQLLYFWTHPVRAFFQMRLQVNFRLEEKEIPDAEPFTLDNHSCYQLNKQLLNALLIQEDAQQKLFRHYRAAGQLPYGAFGEIIWDAHFQEMQVLADRVRKYLQPATSQEIYIECAGIKLTGWLQHVQPDGLLRWRPAMISVSQCMQLWLEHLIYCASGGKGESRLFMRKDGEWRFPPLAQEHALYYLLQMIEGYRQGMRKPLLLLPESGGAWIKACYDAQNDDLLTDEASLQKARTRFLQVYNGNMMVRGEGDDVWYHRLWRTLEPGHFDAIIHEAKRYLLPIYKFNQSS